MSKKEYNKRWHQRNKARRLPILKAQKAARKAAALEWLREHKNANPCTDCGVRYPYYVMEFDHLPEYEKSPHSKKSRNIRAVAAISLKALKEEITKCEIVCANCHRERTHQRRTHHETIK